MDFDRDKFKALVLYVVWRAGHRDGFGATKLNKVLWFADARAYMMYRKPITGATYIREKRGPVPREMLTVRRELESEGKITITEEPYYSRQLTRFRASAESPPDTSLFTEEEISLVDWWIKHVDEEHTAESISETSHDRMWELALPGEEIPLYAVFATRIRAPRGKELEWAKKEAERLGLE
jgi:hypothetical protein